MMYKTTDLRRQIYKVLDQVLETGQAVEIERRGRRLKIVPVDRPSPMQRLAPMQDLIEGDPAELEHIDWSGEWRP